MVGFKVPSDIAQIPIVWKYELLKYLRSWRLVASIAITFVVMGLIFFLPPAFGRPYSGTDDFQVKSNEMINLGTPTPYLPYSSLTIIGRTGVVVSDLVVTVNGTNYPSDSWFLAKMSDANQIPSFISDLQLSGTYLVLFKDNLTGSVVTLKYDWRITAETFELLNLNFANILIIICATFFAADSISGEYYNRTGYLIFPNPMKREILFFGKYSASMTAGVLVVGLFYIGVSGFSLAAAGEVDEDTWKSFLFGIEYLLAATAVGYVISSLLKGTTGAIVLTFFLLFLILPIVDGVAMFTGVKIAASLTFAGGVMIYILQDPYPVDTTMDFGGSPFSIYYPEPSVSAIVMLAWAAAAIIISLVLFKRKQLAG